MPRTEVDIKVNLRLAVGSLCMAVGHYVTVLLTLTLHFGVRGRPPLTLGGVLFTCRRSRVVCLARLGYCRRSSFPVGGTALTGLARARRA